MKNLILILAITTIFSCSNDENKDSAKLSGIYTETAPTNGRTQLNFNTSSTVIKSEPGSSIEDEFTYELIGNKIILTPTWDSTITTQFKIEITNNSKFKIENLYPSIPKAPIVFITFEK